MQKKKKNIRNKKIIFYQELRWICAFIYMIGGNFLKMAWEENGQLG